MVAAVREHGSQVTLGLLKRIGGYGDTPWCCQPLQARCDVNAVAQDIVPVDNDITDIDADTIVDASVIRLIRLALLHRILDVDSALNRIDRAGKLHQQSIARGFEHTPIEGSDSGINQGFAVTTLPGDCTGLIDLHQPRIANHIRCEDRRQPPLKTLSCHEKKFPFFSKAVLI